ncbi:NADH dehydrogenase [ubiquinone] 1 beta subcomplex subunit 2, mitochondrial-like [Drosophila kikkawai]|uniref:NADH dehydrogenase [ubiquinone] 1 beta subcomplex subunit 2, mitochondrial-like n=1 Tax=Drosophila kikkawai TaxID=30033 RepID=A0A6P4JP82_DROKI|nr:NADH dehydrogenase [ubiquinone] 1 beta subcomplex subunit 2, mitochondrial-like [Drosophila kikkawai]
MSIALKLVPLKTSIGFINRRIIENNIFKRNSHVVSYRNAPPPHSKATRIGAVAVGATMWWWVLWHLWHEPDHITGEFDYPNPKTWSNSELGIPKDDL